MRKHFLFVHYNPNSDGSFVDRTLALIEHLSKTTKITVMIPGDGPFTQALYKVGAQVKIGKLNENNGIVSYLLHYLNFIFFLIRARVSLVYYLDWVWWKPAEVLAVATLKIPSVAHINSKRDEFAFKSFLPKVDRFIVNSRQTGDPFFHGGLGDRTTISYNFIDVQKYLTAESIRSEFCSTGEKLVAYVGVIQRIKGIEYLLRSIPSILPEFPNTKFILVGREKDPGLKAELEALSDTLGISERISFLGHREDIPNIMKSIDLLVVPSLEEAFGFINIEAAAAGVPVVASRVGGIPEVVEDGVTGYLVPPKDPSAIAQAVNHLLGNPELRSQLGLQGRERTERLFSKEIGLKSTIEALRITQKINCCY